MDYIEQIKAGIERLYKTNSNIHISASRTHPKVIIDSATARIVGLYKNIFQIEECGGSKMPTRHTFQYCDVLIGLVKIEELNYVPTTGMQNKK